MTSPVNVSSRDGRISVQVRVDGDARYSVRRDGQELIAPSLLSLDLAEAPNLGPMKLLGTASRPVSEVYSLPVGKTRNVSARGNELTVRMQERTGLHREVDLVFRAFDDGVAFRYVVPKQPGLTTVALRDEHSEFAIAGNPTLYTEVTGFASPYEDTYRIGDSAGLPTDKAIALPFVARYANGTVLGVTEAGLVDYPNAYVTPMAAARATLRTVLAPNPNGDEVKARVSTPFASPWRAMVIGDSAKTLVESNMVTTLAPASVLTDTSWIAPGKVQFGWWNGYVTPDGKGGLNEATLKHYIDFCSANGIEYASIDGYEFDAAWYGGKVLPYTGADVTKPIPELNLPEVMRYAKERGVKVRIWLHQEGLTEANMEHVLSTYESWGAAGVMVDFMGRDDQAGVRYQRLIVETAARHHLTVAFHGIAKPTGLTRTYPNLLTFEGVRGLEYDKWDKGGVTPDHEVLATYVRMLAGPLDTHQGSFRPVPAAQFVPKPIAPNVIGTLSRTLASYVVYENHAPMLSDYPEAYTAQPDAFGFVRQVPATWDETRFVAGELGHSVSIARRQGDTWFVGTMTDGNARTLELPMRFLAAGKYVVETYADGATAATDGQSIVTSRRVVTRNSTIAAALAPAGGHAMRIRPLAKAD